MLYEMIKNENSETKQLIHDLEDRLDWYFSDLKNLDNSDLNNAA